MLSIDKYWNLICKIDQFASEWSTDPPFPLTCQEGCDECCRAHITLFAVEIAAISKSLTKRGKTAVDRVKPKMNGTCPFLEEKRCLIYATRPILCRTQGYPFVYLDEQGNTASDICSRNRTGTEISLPAKFVLNLETLNRCLSSLNFLYLAEMEERGTIVPARLDILQILDFQRGLEE